MILRVSRRHLIGLGLSFVSSHPALAARPETGKVLTDWYALMLELVRHTPTYSPPVASRTFAYVGIAGYEAVASLTPSLQSLAGQLNGLTTLPAPASGKRYDDSIVLHASLCRCITSLFDNTGPTGQRALAAQKRKIEKALTAGKPRSLATRSMAHGEAIADHILVWAATDGGAVIDNLGFPATYELAKQPGRWVPTNPIALQQHPLLPSWGSNRTLGLAGVGDCGLPPPPAHSEDKTSEFYRQALETYEVRKNLTAEQKAIARFWADDAMLSTTPPGHWIEIALAIFERDSLPLDREVETLALLGVAMADAFIACWHEKYRFNLVRPVTYIKENIDPKFEPLLITPPFPEYPSGHSVQSGAAEVVLTKLLGENVAFDDASRERDGLPARKFTSFHEAAEEAGISRLYGGIHFRAAIEHGLEQGRCIGAAAAKLQTRKTTG